MIYKYSDLITAIGVDSNTTSNILAIANRAAREVVSDVDLRSTKRKASLSPQLYKRVWDYGKPSDMKDWALIDIRKQIKRVARWTLTSNEEFDARKSINKQLITISDLDGNGLLRISADVDSKELILNDMDSLTNDGTWTASGDASNLAVDYQDFMNGSASLSFNSAVNFTSAILENSTMSSADLTLYKNHEIFLWLKFPITAGVTSVKLRFGSSSGAYWEATATTNNEGTAFYTGWNLLRFAWPATSIGTPVITAINYLRIQIVGAGTAVAATAWKADFVVARIGDIHYVIYYSKFGWQTSAGVYIENSTVSTDLLNADTEEFELFVLKGKQKAYEDLQLFQEATKYEQQYEIKRQKYLNNYPSERMLIVDTYEYFETIELSNDSQDNNRL